MPDVVERATTGVVFVRCADDVDAIRAAWSRLEEAVPLRGHHFFGTFDGREYRACADADVAGLERGTIPGGLYARVRLRGEPPAVYDLIAPTFEELERTTDVDSTRPFVEHYRRRNEIDLLVPVA